jgi:hypothetical protein
VESVGGTTAASLAMLGQYGLASAAQCGWFEAQGCHTSSLDDLCESISDGSSMQEGGLGGRRRTGSSRQDLLSATGVEGGYSGIVSYECALDGVSCEDGGSRLGESCGECGRDLGGEGALRGGSEAALPHQSRTNN